MMDAKRSERKPAKSGLHSSARKTRGINANKPHARTFSFDEVWTYVGARRGKKRRSVWIWTAAVEEWDGSIWSDFEVGYRDAETFLRLLRRLPKAAKYGSGHCGTYSLPPPVSHVKGKGSEVNRNEGLHSKPRVKPNRLVRRTRGYSKRLCMFAGMNALIALAFVLWLQLNLNIAATQTAIAVLVGLAAVVLVRHVRGGRRDVSSGAEGG